MAGHARYTAVLDACVLYSIAHTDALLSVATTGVYAPKWTQEIDREWTSALLAKNPGKEDKILRRRDQMREAVLDWEIDEAAWRSVVTVPPLPDPKDMHVLAAAIVGHADCIVTRNLRDFPEDIIKPLGIEIIDPDIFLLNQWDLRPQAVIAAFRGMRERRFDPRQDPEEFAASIERSGLLLTADRLRSVLELL